MESSTLLRRHHLSFPQTPKPSHTHSSSTLLHFPSSSSSIKSKFSIKIPFRHSPQTLNAQTFPSSSTAQPLFNPFKSTATKTHLPPLRVNHSDTQILPASDRMISIIAYFLPFLNNLPYGYHLFQTFPLLEAAFNPLVPILAFYKSIPFVNLIAFFAIFVGIIRDGKRFSRYVRLNAYQSLLMDFISVLPYCLRSVAGLFECGDGLLVDLINSATFVVFWGLFVYAALCCAFGKRPRFGVVSDLIEARLAAEDRFFGN